MNIYNKGNESRKLERGVELGPQPKHSDVGHRLVYLLCLTLGHSQLSKYLGEEVKYRRA